MESLSAELVNVREELESERKKNIEDKDVLTASNQEMKQQMEEKEGKITQQSTELQTIKKELSDKLTVIGKVYH